MTTATPAWARVPRPRRAGRRRPGPVVVALVAVPVATAVLARRGVGWPALALPAIGALLLPLAIRLAGADPAAVVARGARAVGRAVTTALFALLAVPMVLLPHVLGSRRPEPSAWTRPPRGKAPIRARWAYEDRRRTATVAGTARALAIPVLVLMLVWSWALRPPPPAFQLEPGQPDRTGAVAPNLPPDERVPDGVEASTPQAGEVPAALLDDPWWSSQEYQVGQQQVLDVSSSWRRENPYSVLDTRSRYVNMEGGIRRSWRPAPCDCRRVTVWVYGGSTAWGMYQRDEHTIASELSRVAFDHGLTVDVENRGLFWFNHWKESERFAWDLSVEPGPDLAVFYDGVNEIGIGADFAGELRRPPETPVDPPTVDIWPAERFTGPLPEAPPAAAVPDVTPPDRGEVARAREIVHRYDRARRMTERTAEAARVPVRYVWQPFRHSRPFVSAEPHWDSTTENALRVVHAITSQALADDVIDLSDALDHDDEPVYVDDVHHDERGARLIAEALFAALQDDLEALARS